MLTMTCKKQNMLHKYQDMNSALAVLNNTRHQSFDKTTFNLKVFVDN